MKNSFRQETFATDVYFTKILLFLAIAFVQSNIERGFFMAISKFAKDDHKRQVRKISLS